MAATIGLVLDSPTPSHSPFWSEALGYTTVGEAAQLRDARRRGRREAQAPATGRPRAQGTKNRMHLDVHVPDIEGEAARLGSLGARRLERDARTEFRTN